MAYAPLQDPHLDEILAAHAQYANLRGIRQILNPDQCEPSDYLTDPPWRMGYARLAEYDLSFDLQALSEQMLAAAEVAAAYPISGRTQVNVPPAAATCPERSAGPAPLI